MRKNSPRSLLVIVVVLASVLGLAAASGRKTSRNTASAGTPALSKTNETPEVSEKRTPKQRGSTQNVDKRSRKSLSRSKSSEAAKRRASAAEEEEEGQDPDRPAGAKGRFDESEYLQQREAFIALRRGVDPR